MSGRFMHVKKIVVPMITLLVLTSQLVGCASTSQKEMLDMLNRQESITIEVAEPISQEQGTEIPFEWQELASLTTYPEFRDVFDDALNITTHGTNGKNGVVYVDLEGNHTNNSTLRYAFANKKFLDNCWNNSETLKQLCEAAKSTYVDVETDAVAKVAMINAYFNIFADAEPNYFNPSETLTRGEYLAGVYRAGNPVSELQEDKAFKDSIDATGTDETTVFASQMLDYSYLSTTDESLNASTYSGKITRAEAIYTLVRMYYNDEYEATTGNEVSYSDAKNGGDIASKVGFITKDKKTGELTYNKYWKSYELSYALQNPDKGMPTDLFKALVVAKNHGIISGTESRWDEAVTKGEAINFIIRVYENLGTLTNADRGNSSSEIVVTIDFKDIDPEIHATHDETTGTITVDDTMIKTMRSKCPYFQSYIMPKAVAQSILAEYLDGYYKGRFDDNAWLQFALTGDQEYLNLEVTDSDLLIQNEQQVDEWLQTEEGQKTKAEVDAAKGTEEEQQERLYNTLAETMGLSVEEVKALMAESESSSSTSSGNTGGGSSQIATPSTNQSSANENNFVTPETNTNEDDFVGDGTFQLSPSKGNGGEYTSDPNDIHFNQ